MRVAKNFWSGETYTPLMNIYFTALWLFPCTLMAHSEKQGPNTIKILHPITVTHLNSLYISSEWLLHILSSTRPSQHSDLSILKCWYKHWMPPTGGSCVVTLQTHCRCLMTGTLAYIKWKAVFPNRKQTDIWAWTCVIHHAPWHAVSGKGSGWVWGSSKEQGHLG